MVCNTFATWQMWMKKAFVTLLTMQYDRVAPVSVKYEERTPDVPTSATCHQQAFNNRETEVEREGKRHEGMEPRKSLEKGSKRALLFLAGIG